jgi:para-aminobenzoate synthetase component 1
MPHRLTIADSVSGSMDDPGFLEEAKRIAALPYGCVLLSGGDHECAGYSVATWDPFLCMTAKGRRVELLTAANGEVLEADPFEVLEELLSGMRAEYPLDALPFRGGAVGYLAYELKNHLERLPQTAADDLGLPDLFLAFPRNILVHDRLRRTCRNTRLEWDGAAGSLPAPTTGPAREPWQGVESNFTREAYHRAVRRIREYIRAGDVYQVNLSRRFTLPYRGDPFRLFRDLHAVNPAPFYAFVNGGDHRVISTSMERFLFRRGDLVETRPIKGTRRRGRSGAEDAALKDDLRRDPKDDAELSMIVDLMRNDLSRVCLPGSVRVREHRRIEEYRNVFHLVSAIDGQLEEGTSHVDLLRAAFPGGSITGCPRIRAMEIIDELEPNVRHAYTGAIGYLGLHGNLDLNIAIRTAILREGICRFPAGGGVVHDSDEESEYRETADKARTFLQSAVPGYTG